MTEKTLNTLLEKSKKDGMPNEPAIAALAEYLYTNLARFRLDYLDDDTRGDFLVSIYPRLGRIIEQFDPERAAFSTYIRSVVRLSWRTFTRDRYGSEARQKVYNTEEATRLLSMEAECTRKGEWPRIACDDEPVYMLERAFSAEDRLSRKKQELHARRMYLLACKSGLMLDDRMLCLIAARTGLDRDFLRVKLEEIRDSCAIKKEKLQKCIEKRNGYYIRTQRCLYEMKYLEKESTRYSTLEKEYRYCLKRWTDMHRQALRKISTPSNRFLAETLGISRGTIDATLASHK